MNLWRRGRPAALCGVEKFAIAQLAGAVRFDRRTEVTPEDVALFTIPGQPTGLFRLLEEQG